MPVTKTRCCPQQMGTDGKTLILQITWRVLRVIAWKSLSNTNLHVVCEVRFLKYQQLAPTAS